MKRKFQLGKKECAPMPMRVKKIDRENYTLTMVASTQDTDRHGDVIVQKGWDLEHYLRNPVILNSHNYDDVTEVIAKATRTEIIGKGKRSRLEQDWKFAVDENPKAKIIFDLYAGEYVTASSVGFIVRKFRENDDGTTDYYTIEEAELLEVSAVSVPANARALAKKKGIDVDELPKEMFEEETKTASDGGDDNPEPEPEEKPEEEEVPEEPETPEDPEEEKVIEPEAKKQTPEEKRRSDNLRIVRALSSIERRQQKILQSAVKTLQEMIDEDPEVRKIEAETREKIRKRKVNKAIRQLFKLK